MLYLKAIHLIFIITWFAGLFYLVRLFVYHAETVSMPETERKILSQQYKLMQRRLWFGITWPSMLITISTGIWLLVLMRAYIFPWMHIKLLLVFLLIIYHFMCGHYFNQLQQDVSKKSSMFFRYFNEVATLLLVSIVFIVVLKQLDALWAIAGFILFALLLFAGIKLYKRSREKKERL